MGSESVSAQSLSVTDVDDEGLNPSRPSSNELEKGDGPDPESCLALLRGALRSPDQLTAMISNYSTSYNAVNVGIVLPVLNYSIASLDETPSAAHRDAEALSESHPPSMPAVARRLGDEGDDEQDSVVASSLLAGMIFGQLFGGYLGDVLGPRRAMTLVMMLQIGGSVGSALLVSVDDVGGLTALEQLAVWRFVLGIGAGGVYPLAAVMSAAAEGGEGAAPANASAKERGRNDEGDDRSDGGRVPPSAERKGADIGSFRRIALTFSTQGLGFITVPLLAYPMLEWRWNVDVIWRTLLGLGALPGILVLYLRLCSGGAERKNHSKVRTDPDRSDGEEANRGHDAMVGNDSPGAAPAEDGNSAEKRGVVSSLFEESTSFVEGSPEQSDNEMALVENSHLEISNENGDDHRGDSRDDGAIHATDHHTPGLLESIQAEPNLKRKFIGTAGAWFLFDVLFYGNTLFEPFVLEAAFGSHASGSSDGGYELLQATVRDSLVISLLSLPGYFVTVFLIGRRTCACRSSRTSSATRCGSAPCFPCHQTPAYIQMQGFFFMFILYIVIGMFWASLSDVQWLLLLLYAGTFFFANYGPNTTTFLLPSITYSEECKSTLNGISAAAGKIGALVGASIFAPAADDWGENVVMVCCGCVSLIAWALTKICLGERDRVC